METDRERTPFSLGDPVLVATDRPLGGWLTGASDIPHIGAIDFPHQSFRGQKGWVFATSAPASGGAPRTYEVAFRLRGNARAVMVHQQGDAGVVLAEERQVARGRGRLMDLKPEDLDPDPAPEGTFEELMDEMYEAGEFDLAPVTVLHEAERFLEARQAARDPEGYLARRRAILPQLAGERPDLLQKSLENHQADWQHFQESGGASITGYIRRYIEAEDAGRLDWTPILSAIEQAERGDRTALEALVENVYIEGREILSLGTGRRDPGVPTTACFDCDAILPVADTWVNQRDLPLCETCFRNWEAKGRARRRRQAFARE